MEFFFQTDWFKIAAEFFFELSRALEQILTEHIESIYSLESELTFDFSVLLEFDLEIDKF